MADILLLLGAALCVLSIPAALISLLRTEAPRAAAILLVGGVLALALAAWVQPGSVGFAQIGAAWGWSPLLVGLLPVAIGTALPEAAAAIHDADITQAISARLARERSLREAPMLFFEFHGSPTGVEEQAQTVQELARDNGGQDFEWATRPEDRSRLWQARHDVLFACLNLQPGSRGISTDVCVPISRLAEAIAGTQEEIAATGLIAPIVGHVGDGNFHVVILTEPDNPDQVHAAEALGRRIVERALALDGTCTGEHGIGIGKKDFLLAEHGEGVAVMASLKAALDPLGLMNPGKVL